MRRPTLRSGSARVFPRAAEARERREGHSPLRRARLRSVRRERHVFIGRGAAATIDASEPVEHSTKTAAVFSALMSLPKGVKLGICAGHAGHRRGVALTKSGAGDAAGAERPLLADHAELHRGLRADALRRACRSHARGAGRRVVGGAVALRARTGGRRPRAARPDAEPKLADEWVHARKRLFASLRGSFYVFFVYRPWSCLVGS